MNESIRLAQAIANCYPVLPGLVDDDRWADFEVKLTKLLRQLDDPEEDHDSNQADLLLLFREHPSAYERLQGELCRLEEGRVVQASSPEPLIAKSGTDNSVSVRFTCIPVFFATDRMLSERKGGNSAFLGTRNPGGTLSFGFAEVSIPDDHRMGKLEKPRWWKLQFRPDPNKHVTILTLDLLDRAVFTGRARAAASAADLNECLIFIHGYNVSFDDALRRTAQIVYDLHFEGIPIAYSWPSEADAHKYTIDEGNINWTRPHLRDFLTLVMAELALHRVHVIAHSMGSRALADIIPTIERSDLPECAASLRQVIFAAPDIDASTFRELARQFRGKADRFTLYASSNDKALKASRLVHKYARAGDSGDDLPILDTLDTIDASFLDTGFMSHSYYGENRSILTDLLQLVRIGNDPKDRGLRPRQKDGGIYWQFPR